MSILYVKDLCFSYQQDIPILENISFNLQQGEILGILGPNGGGKSTLLKLLAGLLPPNSGVVEYEGHQRPAMVYIPQREESNHILPITIDEYLDTARYPEKIDNKKKQEALQMVSVSLPRQTLLRDLSGGQHQRVLLAKAWLANFRLLILDEPTKGLDSQGQDDLLKLLKRFKEQRPCAIILVDHHIQQVLKHCDRLLCLNRTFHWHEKTEQVDKHILEETYRCEFEHLLIHEHGGDILHHHHSHHKDDNGD